MAKLAAVVAALLSAAGGYWLGSSETQAAATTGGQEAEVKNPQVDDRAELAAIPREERETAAAESEVHQPAPKTIDTEGERQADELLNRALLNYFDREFRREWKAERELPPSDSQVAAGLTEYRKIVLESPGMLGRRNSKDANEYDTARSGLKAGDALLVLAAAAEHDIEFSWEELNDEFFARALNPRQTGERIDGVSLEDRKRATLQDGTLIEFGPGLHRLKPDHAFGRKEFPADLTIQGAGMNSTLLTIDTLHTRDEVQRLRIKNLTIDCANNYMFDLRSAGLSLDLENVRIVRFDMGAGGSLVFGVNDGLFLRAVNCEFLGGYGRSPVSGNLFRGDALVATFTGCTFQRVGLRLHGTSAATTSFVNCIFREYHEEPTETLDARFENCSVLPLISWGEYVKPDVRSLSELFPAWQDD